MLCVVDIQPTRYNRVDTTVIPPIVFDFYSIDLLMQQRTPSFVANPVLLYGFYTEKGTFSLRQAQHNLFFEQFQYSVADEHAKPFRNTMFSFAYGIILMTNL